MTAVLLLSEHGLIAWSCINIYTQISTDILSIPPCPFCLFSLTCTVTALLDMLKSRSDGVLMTAFVLNDSFIAKLCNVYILQYAHL